jgi:TetR/AcrR family transcriptional regulator, cholesterol catabolism regulator
MAGAVPKKTNKKKLIIALAAALFRTRGYSATSMRDIADAVGIEAASLYNPICCAKLYSVLPGIATNIWQPCNCWPKNPEKKLKH